MSTKTKRPVRRTATVLAAVGALLASTGAALLLTANTASAAPGDKYFVCKYVHKPGSPEVLQGGGNPISTSAVPDPVVIGAFFNDNQGRSYVLALDDTPPGPEGDPPASQCPIGDPDVLIVVDVVFTDPSCENDNTASYVVNGDTDNVDVEESAAPAADTEVTVTATAHEGFTFGTDDPYSETHTFGSEVDCTLPPVVDPPPPVVDPPAETPTIVHAGLVDAPVATVSSEEGIALLAAGLLLMLAAGGMALPRGARR